MNFELLETELRKNLQEGAFTIEKRVAQDQLTLRVLSQPDLTPIATVRAWQSEIFFLELANGYEFQDFDWEEEGQAATIRSFAQIIRAFTEGRGRVVSKRTILGEKSEYEVSVGDDTWRSKGRRNPSDVSTA